MSILELDKVSYKYSDGNKYVLKDLSYKFEKGRTYAIKGKSGSGKTILLSILSGLEKSTSGKVIYNKKDLNEMDLDKYRNSFIGIIFQSYNLLSHLTAIENIILSMDVNGMNVKDKHDKAVELLKRVGLDEETGNRRVLRLSGGEQQRVAIARSLSYNPDIILADEPTGNLDLDTENEIINIFNKLAKEENKCIIIVTHSKNVSEQVDEVFELNNNKKDK